jgi:integrase
MQFAWRLLNWDLPWNPARLEQRMGRIHRYKQEHDPVYIVNLVAGKTREGRVMQTLLDKLERIRKELGRDKVFDVIGRLFEGVSLKEYMERAVRTEGADAACHALEGTLTKEQVEALEAKERRIYGDGGDVKAYLSAERAKLDREGWRRLLPGYVRRFIEKSTPLLGLGIEGDLDGNFALKALRPGALDFLWNLLESYPPARRHRLAVLKPTDTAEALFLHPGEPVFERIRVHVCERFAEVALRGGVFVDPTAAAPYLFHLAAVSVSRRADPAHPTLARVEVLEHRLVGLRQAADESLPDCTAPACLTIAELIERYWGHAKTYYRRDGEPTGEHEVIRFALRPLLKMFAEILAAEFRPRHLKAVRAEMIRMDWSRRYINDSIRRVRRMFVWGAEEELIPPEVASGLAMVKGLREDRSEARDKPRVQAVPDERVRATVSRVSPLAADIIRVMRLSGMRPGEAVRMTVEEIDRADPDCWRYRPTRHKTRHRGKTRTVFIGPKCQEILTPWIVKAGSGRVFPMTASGLRTAIIRGCRRAGIKPHWTPNMLRHAAATEIRRTFGLEASQVILGHSRADTTEIYAEVNIDRGREIALKIG